MNVPQFMEHLPSEFWIHRVRYDEIAPVIERYLSTTKGRHNNKLLHDVARQIYRFSLDRNDINPKEIADKQFDFYGGSREKWEFIDGWQYADAQMETSWYLIFACNAPLEMVDKSLGSLGIHVGERQHRMNQAFQNAPSYFCN